MSQRDYIPIDVDDLPEIFEIELADVTFNFGVSYNAVGDFLRSIYTTRTSTQSFWVKNWYSIIDYGPTSMMTDCQRLTWYQWMSPDKPQPSMLRLLGGQCS